ncbi:hypothetical protein [Streptomyces sp. NPDC050560]|uniref:hypothetical protein n=1 Tax=Streptomyces sp. NPDC050560 TaxID=3365630 RepID=UPI0037911CCC
MSGPGAPGGAGLLVGPGASRWRTFGGRRVLVAAVRTLTSTVRLLETLPALLRGDRRLDVVYAFDPTSAFNEGVLGALRAAGCRVLPWPQLGSVSPDLIVTASENLDLPRGDCPVLVLPHGVGFQKLVPDARGPGTRVSGMVPDEWLESGRAWLAVSHPDQERQLVAAQPKAAGRTLLVGDPVLDGLSASLSLADSYRAALGAGDGRRLVVLSSTWGPASLIGRRPDLPAQLLAELPYDRYRVALVLHPNVWSAHGAWHIETLLADALDAGLLLVPPVHEWRQALVAAHAVVGDHGSVTLYGAALGKPVLLGAFGDDAVPGTAITALGATAPRLGGRGERGRQIAAAVRDGQGAARAVAAAAFADEGHALDRLRDALYRLVGLSEPESPAPRARRLPPPAVAARPVTSWMVATDLARDGGRRTVAVRRRPAAVFEEWTEPQDALLHLACDDREADAQLTQSAAVLVRGEPVRAAVEALAWIGDTLRAVPGSRVAAVPLGPRQFLVGLRDGRVYEVATTGPALDAGVPAAAVYACLCEGEVEPDGALVALRVDAGRAQDVSIRLRHGTRPAG